jgi:hypothetical protein
VSHRLLLVLAALLAFPLVGLATIVGHQEYLRASAPVITVALRGVDPRDLLRGHYLVGDLAWNWAPDGATAKQPAHGRICLTQTTGSDRLSARFMPIVETPPQGSCTAVLAGWYTPGVGGFGAGFTPNGVGGDYQRQLRFYVPQAQAQRLETLMRERPGALAVDLAVLPDETAVIKGLRVDGVPFNR